jgi:hypothetical protein
MSVRSALYVSALVLGIAVLFVVAAFGAIVVLVYHDRRAGFSFFARPDVKDDQHRRPGGSCQRASEAAPLRR